jgi:RNA recognition motif-containing protein
MIAQSKQPAPATVRLFVGNLPYQTTEQELAALFIGVANVISAEIALDRHSGQSLGRGWVEIDVNDDVDAVIAKMDRLVTRTRPIHVSIAHPPRNSSRPLLQW